MKHPAASGDLSGRGNAVDVAGAAAVSASSTPTMTKRRKVIAPAAAQGSSSPAASASGAAWTAQPALGNAAAAGVLLFLDPESHPFPLMGLRDSHNCHHPNLLVIVFASFGDRLAGCCLA